MPSTADADGERAAAGAPDTRDAVAHLARGGLVACPTETVWGLAADAANLGAVAALRAWKGREDTQPISVFVTGVEEARERGFAFSAAALRLADAFWPGPLTLVTPAAQLGDGALSAVAREDGAVGLRCADHPDAARLAKAARAAGLGPLTATSLNRRGEPPACTRAEAIALVAGANVLVYEDGDAHGATPSTIIDTTAAERVLRWGAIGQADLNAILSPPAGFEEPPPVPMAGAANRLSQEPE